MKKEGIILKGIDGFYYVEAVDEVYECKARGVFRKNGVTPLAGDRVIIDVGNANAENTIDEILKRKNYLKRPPVANLDKLFIVLSTCQPQPNLLLADRLTVCAEHKEIEPIFVITKNDLANGEKIAQIYKKVGYKTIAASGVDNESIDIIRSELYGSISVFTGNSGVGKSTLLNAIDEKWSLQTDKISEKLGRGKHTTRHVELLKVSMGYVADTPGFSSLEADLQRDDFISAQELQYCFREFSEHIGRCKFSSCTHISEKGCAVIEAVNEGLIPISRHNSYRALFNEVKDIRDWQLK